MYRYSIRRQNISAQQEPKYRQGYFQIYPGYVLSPGLENSDVANLQQFLGVISAACDFIPPVETTGIYADASTAAVTAVQSAAGVAPYGCRRFVDLGADNKSI